MMKSLYMVTIRYEGSTHEKVLDYFASHGIVEYREHIEVLSHWTGVREPISFLLIESKDPQQAELAFKDWQELGDVSASKVLAAEDY